jgi:hypothetical protein
MSMSSCFDFELTRLNTITLFIQIYLLRDNVSVHLQGVLQYLLHQMHNNGFLSTQYFLKVKQVRTLLVVRLAR